MKVTMGIYDYFNSVWCMQAHAAEAGGQHKGSAQCFEHFIKTRQRGVMLMVVLVVFEWRC